MNPPRRGLLGSARALLGTTLELAQVRLALLANDVEAGTLRLFDALVLAALALLGIGVGIVLLCLLVLLLIQDTYRIPVLLVMALVFLAAGAWALNAARSSLRQAGGAFEATRAELARDLAALARRDPPA
jgi:uncharacterized membrane protein YqjE